MRAILLCLAIASAACAQTLARPSAGGWPNLPDTLRCEVIPVRPVLNFSLRLQAGYTVVIPLNQFRGEGHFWSVLVRVLPKDRDPVYLRSRYNLPPVPETKSDGQVGGGFLLGQGRYDASLLVRDDAGRTCTRNWQIDAPAGRQARGMQMAVPPGAVTPLYVRPASVHVDEPVIGRLTVLLHAAPVSRAAPRLRTGDVMMWLGELSALLQQVPARAVRLVVFNLAQQRELFREDNFRMEELSRVQDVIYGLQLGMVDYRLLQNPGGETDLLARLVNEERTGVVPSDSVVFLGPRLSSPGKFPPNALYPVLFKSPRFFYVDYRTLPTFAELQTYAGMSDVMNMPSPNRVGPGDTDVIHSLMSLVDGKTIDVYRPTDFAKAIRRITAR